nr:hypothetical protein [Tanacetum cinerariifolium]
MMKRVIAFEDFLVPHTGSALARVLRKTFGNFNLEDKIMSITLDNASNNTSAIGKLKLKYEPPMAGRFYHSLCIVHIINLVVQDGLAVPAINAIKESFKTMLKDVFKSGGKNHQRKAKKWFTNSLEGLHNIYYAKYGNPKTTESSIGASLSRASGGNQMTRLLYQLKEHTNKKAMSDPSLSSEYERYVHSNFVTQLEKNEFATFDLLGFWKTKESIFLVLSRMAMDIISVQPTSDHLDAQERKQHKSSLENAVDFEKEILNSKVQQNESIPLSEEEIALDVASSEGTMSGSGSGGEKVDYDMTN